MKFTLFQSKLIFFSSLFFPHKVFGKVKKKYFSNYESFISVCTMYKLCSFFFIISSWNWRHYRKFGLLERCGIRFALSERQNICYQINVIQAIWREEFELKDREIARVCVRVCSWRNLWFKILSKFTRIVLLNLSAKCFVNWVDIF